MLIRRQKEINGELKTKTIETTVGRLIYNQGIPQDLGFVDRSDPEKAFDLEIDFPVIKKNLGKVENEVDKVMMVHAMHEIEEQVSERMKKEAAQAQREAEKEREKEIAMLLSVEPFQIGNKWGLRKEGRIVVAPIYRMIKQPIGRYCAFEKNPRQWGVMAVDGQIEVEPRYEEVIIHPDGMVDLTVRPGKVTTMQLSPIHSSFKIHNP